jgi:hypothetical protein
MRIPPIPKAGKNQQNTHILMHAYSVGFYTHNDTAIDLMGLINIQLLLMNLHERKEQGVSHSRRFTRAREDGALPLPEGCIHYSIVPN